MADSTVALLADGVTANATDLLYALRDPFGAGNDVKITPAYIKDYIRALANTWTATQTLTPAVNTNALAVTGYSLTGANAQGLIDLNGTWNTSGSPVALKIAMTNTASGATAKFLEFLAGAGGATSVFDIDKAGTLTIANNAAFRSRLSGGTLLNLIILDAGNNLTFGAAAISGNTVFLPGSGQNLRFLNAASSAYFMEMRDSDRFISFGSNTHDTMFTFFDATATTGDTAISVKDGAARAARLRFGSNAGTYDVGFNREAAGVLAIQDASTTLTNYRDLKARNLITPGVAVASLPSASTPGAGARAYVTDASAPTFGATVAGGGAVGTPVYSDGTNWKVG